MLDRNYTFTVASRQPFVDQCRTALHVIAIVACWLNGLGYGYRLLLTLMVLASWKSLSMQSIRQAGGYLHYTAPKHWSFSADGEKFNSVTIQKSTYLSPWLIILHYRSPNTEQLKSGTLLITREALSEDEYRRLQVMLKLSRDNQNR